MGSTRRLPAPVALALVCAALVPAGLSASLGTAHAAAATGTLLVSRSAAASGAPSISPDGRFVAFTTGNDVFLAQAAPGTTPYGGTPVRISLGDSGEQPNGRSYDPSVSADGHYVAFTSEASNLVAGDTNGQPDVFVRDVRLGRTTRVQGAAQPTRTDCPGGQVETGATTQSAISADGEIVVFTSGASNLVPGDDNCRRDVFRLDRETGQVTRLSQASPAFDPALSGDGRAASYTTQDGTETHAWHWTAARTVALGRNAAGDRAGQTALSGDGVVAYVSHQTSHHGVPLPAGAKVFVEYPGGHWEWVSDGLPSGTPVSAPALSADGSAVAFVAGGQVRLAATESRYGAAAASAPANGSDGQAAPAVGPALSSQPAVTAAGRSVALTTTTPLAGDGDTSPDVAVVGLPGKDQLLHPALDTFAGFATPAPLGYVDPARIPASATTGGTVTSAGRGGIGRGGIGRGGIGRGGIGRGGIGLGILGRGGIGRGGIGRGGIGRGGIGQAFLDLTWAGRGGIGRGGIGRGGIGHVPLSELTLDSRTPGMEDGWAAILRGTPYEGVPLEAITLAEIAEWAQAVLAVTNQPARHVEAATAISSLRLVDFAEDSVLGELAIGSLLTLSAPVATIPIPGPATVPIDNWRAAVSAQGFDPAIVDAETLVVDLDLLGVDLDRTGLGLVRAHELDPAPTLLPHLFLDELTLGTPLGLVELGSLPPAVADRVVDCAAHDCSTGTILDAAEAGNLRDTGHLGHLAADLPDEITLEELVRAMIPAHLYPWELVQWQALGPGRYAIPKDTGAEGPGFADALAFRAGFDTGPGGAPYIQGASLEVLLPPGTAYHASTVTATGPLEFQTPFGEDGTAVHDHGRTVRFDLGDVPSGTTVTVRVQVTDAVDYAQSAPLTSTLRSSTGEDTATITLYDGPGRADQVDPPAGDSPATAPLLTKANRVHFGGLHSADDVDFVRIADPGPDQRLIVALGMVGGDADLGIFRATPVSAPAQEPRGQQGASVLLEDDGLGGTQQPAPLNILDEAGHELLDGSTHSGTGDEVVSATGGNGPLLVRIASGDGRHSTLPYTIRWITAPEEPEQTCPPVPQPSGNLLDRGIVPQLLLPGTNTIFLVDQERFSASFGTLPNPDDLLGLPITAGQFVVNQLADLDGQFGVKSAVIPISGTDVLGAHSTTAVRAARASYLDNPCSVTAANAFADAVRDLLGSYLTPDLQASLKNVVIVGGDDMIPFHRVPGATVDIREDFNESALRLRTPRTGACIVAPAPGTTCDRKATPLSAAAAGDHVVTDDPYGDRLPARFLDRSLWTPDVAVARLVETPADVRAAVRTFLARGGVIRADASRTGTPVTTALSTGYAAWDELPDAIAEGVADLVRSPADNKVLKGGWSRADLEAALGFAPDGTAPTLLSVNAHSSETSLLPGAADAPDHEVTAADLYDTADLPADVDARLDGRLLYTVGCHAGGTLPDSWYGGQVRDFAQVFGNVGGYVGNTGYGIADTAATALSERLMADYAALLGATVGGQQLTAGQALMVAKRQYVEQLGTYLGYDEKVAMQATYYGLPMYKLPVPAAALTEIGAAATWTPGTELGMATRSTTFDPAFDTVSQPDGSAYLRIPGHAPQVSPGFPILPKLVEPLPPVAGATPHGALVTELTSHADGPTDPAIAGSSVGVDPGIDRVDDLGFPTSIAHVTGHRLALLAGRVSGESTGTSTTGVTERFSHVGVTGFYSASSDHERPVLRTTISRTGGNVVVRVDARDEGGTTQRAVLLHQRRGDTAWTRTEMTRVSGDTWQASVPDPGDFRAFTQVVDAAGNVGIDLNRGHFHVGTDTAPDFVGGTDETIVVYERLVRDLEITDPDSSRFTGTVDWGFGAQELEIRQGPDGVWRAHLDITGHSPGSFEVKVTICDDGGLCRTRTFLLVVLPGNSPPDAQVTLDTAFAVTDQVLRATTTSSDPDGDPVTLTYRWYVDEVLVPGADGPTLDLSQPGHGDDGQTVTVTVVPNDGQVDGLQSNASAVVLPNGSPTVTVADGTGAEGSSYTLSGGAADPDGHDLTAASVDWGDGSPPQPVAIGAGGSLSATHTYADNGTYTVTVTVTDEHGGTGTDTATATIANVAPTIAAVSTPDPVPVGSPLSLTVAFTDPGADTHTVSVDWGDGTSGPATVDQATDTATATHTYAAAGTWLVTVTVTDDDGGQAVDTVYGVVYDPSAGYVTANGTYTSPPGAWPAQATASGQAEIGANVRYTTGSTTPTGKFRFTYDIQPTDKGCAAATCLQFDSTSFASLVVTGSKAVLKGSGTLNGATGHTFVLSVIDGSPDRVRVRILNRQRQVVYDSQPGADEAADPTIPLDGGSVLLKRAG